MKKNAHLLTDVFTIIWGAVLFLSGISKLLDHSSFFSSIKIMLKATPLKADATNAILLTIFFLFIVVELLIGIFLIFKRGKKSIAIALITNILLIAISYKLNSLNKLHDCGCFGSASESLEPWHFIILYFFSGILMLKLFILLSHKKLLC